MERKLRIHAISVQVSLVYDDGEELTPGPALDPVVVSLSQAHSMLDGLPDEVRRLDEQLAAQAAAAEAQAT